MIQVLISLSESAYKEMCENGVGRVDYDIKQLMRDGVLLPKGHGRLIDADNEIKIVEETMSMSDEKYSSFYRGQIATLRMAETIVEADEEGAEE